jgi:hypothetical protein
MHGALDAQILEVRERALAEHVIDATRQRPLARPDCARGLIKRETVGKAFAPPALKLLYERIRMREMIAHRVRRLARARIYDQVTSGRLGK